MGLAECIGDSAITLYGRITHRAANMIEAGDSPFPNQLVMLRIALK